MGGASVSGPHLHTSSRPTSHNALFSFFECIIEGSLKKEEASDFRELFEKGVSWFVAPCFSTRENLQHNNNISERSLTSNKPSALMIATRANLATVFIEKGIVLLLV